MARRPGQNGCVVKKNGNWVGRFYTDVDDGNRVKKSIVLAPATSVTKPEARRKLREILERMGINSMKYTIPTAPAITFGQACDRWEAEFLEGQKPATIKTMKSEVRKHLRPAFDGIALEKLTPSVVNQAIVEWRKQGLSPKSIKNLTITLALIRKHAGLEPFAKGLLCLPKQTEAEVEPPCFSPSEMAAIVAEAKGKYRVVFATAAGTGMRVGESFGLHIADVDLAKGIIHVRRSVFEGAEQSPKTRNGVRWMPVDSELVTLLKSHIGDCMAGYVFVSRNGRPLRTNNVVKRVLHPILRKLGIERCGMHAFRHGRVSFLVEHSVPVELIRQWIGHGSEKMIRRYTHLRPEYHRAVLDKLPIVVPIVPRPEEVTC